MSLRVLQVGARVHYENPTFNQKWDSTPMIWASACIFDETEMNSAFIWWKRKSIWNQETNAVCVIWKSALISHHQEFSVIRVILPYEFKHMTKSREKTSHAHLCCFLPRYFSCLSLCSLQFLALVYRHFLWPEDQYKTILRSLIFLADTERV